MKKHAFFYCKGNLVYKIKIRASGNGTAIHDMS